MPVMQVPVVFPKNGYGLVLLPMPAESVLVMWTKTNGIDTFNQSGF